MNFDVDKKISNVIMDAFILLGQNFILELNFQSIEFQIYWFKRTSMSNYRIERRGRFIDPSSISTYKNRDMLYQITTTRKNIYVVDEIFLLLMRVCIFLG